MICEPLTGQRINECIELNPQLVGLELADLAEQGSRLEVDILVGADYSWRLVTGGGLEAGRWPYFTADEIGLDFVRPNIIQ